MKNKIYGLLGTLSICAIVIGAVFAILGDIIELDFISGIASLAGMVLILAIYTAACIWIFSFDWSDLPFFKASFAGILLAILSRIIYEIYDWELFHGIFVLCAVIAGCAIVIGILKAIFN